MFFGFNTGTKVTDKVGFRSLTACFTAFDRILNEQILIIDLRYTNYLATPNISANYQQQSLLI
jgi:hypothetical protein